MKFLLLLSYLLFFTGFVYAGARENRILNCIQKKMEDSFQQDDFSRCMVDAKGTDIAKLKACMLKVFKARGIVTREYKLNLEAFEVYGEVAQNTSVGLAAHKCYQENHLHYREGMEPAPVTQCIFNELKKTCQYK